MRLKVRLEVEDVLREYDELVFPCDALGPIMRLAKGLGFAILWDEATPWFRNHCRKPVDERILAAMAKQLGYR